LQPICYDRKHVVNVRIKNVPEKSIIRFITSGDR
jgi:hypothetical protein